MAGTSDFLLYANASTNIETQANYLTDTTVPNGRSSGIVPSNVWNKLMRQGTAGSALLGAFIASQGFNANDDGNLSNLTTAFNNALLSFLSNNGRYKLSTNLNLYVNATTGNDTTGNGSSGAPFATIQPALTYLFNKYDLNGYSALINVAAGTYPPCNVAGSFVGQNNPSQVQLLGAGASSCFITSSAAGTPAVAAYYNGAGFTISGFTLTNTGTSSCLGAAYGGYVIFNNVVFASSPSGLHIGADLNGSIIGNGNYAISGGAGVHINSTRKSFVYIGGFTITITGTPAFSTFASIATLAELDAGGTVFSGSATGVRYSVSGNSLLNTAGGGANFFPGNSAGSSSSGGQYT